LLDAATFIRLIEQRQKLKIACLEEIALQQGFLSEAEFREHLATIKNSTYREYLVGLLE